jgi:hypothetical protein
LPQGHYGVDLSVVDLGAWGTRVAFSAVKFSDQPVAHWQVAETTDPGGFTQFFGVDAGLGAYMDADTAKVFATVLQSFEAEHPSGNYYDDVLSRDLPPSALWGEHQPSEASPLKAVVFSSGLGDGLYFSYWGLDAAGQVAMLVTDFQLFDQSGTIVRK